MIASLEELFEQFVFDPSIIDLVIWFPQLSWGDFSTACVLVVAWRTVTNKIERIVGYHTRRTAAWGLLRLALLIRP